MIGKPKAKNLTEQEWNEIAAASSVQSTQQSVPKSYDPQNYPVFEVPVNQKILVYIPNHVTQNPDGTLGLRMDRFAAHPVLDGRIHTSVRCTNGIQNATLGLDGTCPLCDCMEKQWDLYNIEYAGIAKAKGIATDSPEAKELLKDDRRALLDKMTVSKPNIYYTFPIVVIECQEKDGQLTVNPKLDAEGKLVGKPCWYSISEKSFDTWKAAFDSLEDDDSDRAATYNPAGLWAVLNFTYTSDDGKHNKRDSARNLRVSFKTMKEEYAQWATHFDALTESWTPTVAKQVVVLDAQRSMDEMIEVRDTLMKPINDRLDMLRLSQGVAAPPAAPQVGSADNVLANFGAEPVGQGQAQTQQAQPAGQMPPQSTGNIMGEMPNTGVVQG